MKKELIVKDELYEMTYHAIFSITLSFIGSLDDLWVMK